jgi:hypothetical protein
MPRTRKKLPRLLRPFFWDYVFDELSLERDRKLIVERVLTRGTWAAQRWVWENLGDEELRAWLRETSGRSLTPRQLRFWQLLLGLPEDAVDGWIAHKSQSPWFQRTRREASS